MLPATISTLTPRMRFNYGKPKIENFAFKLHYQFTVTLFLAFVILVCAREYFGSHIQCLSDQGVPPNVIQTYCFFMATFTIVSFYRRSCFCSEFYFMSWPLERRLERRGSGRYSTKCHSPYSFILLFRSPVAPPFTVARGLISTLLRSYFSR
jgi:hypothetical protein